jgi:TatD DNase family protein
VVVHARQSERDVLAALEDAGRRRLRGVFHCFTGDRATADRVIRAGYFVGVGGILTFPRSHDVRDTIRALPLDRLLIETDSPYLAPTPHRGKRNEPAWVVRVAETLADLHGLPLEVVVEQTSQNFASLFGPVERP